MSQENVELCSALLRRTTATTSKRCSRTSSPRSSGTPTFWPRSEGRRGCIGDVRASATVSETSSEALGETHIEYPEVRDLLGSGVGRCRSRAWRSSGVALRPLQSDRGPDFSLHDPAVVLDTSNAVFVRARFRGHAGFRDWLATQRDMWRSQRLEAEELIPVGDDRVIVCLRVVGVGRDGIETVAHVANITTLRSGRVSYVRVFHQGRGRRGRRALGAAGDGRERRSHAAADRRRKPTRRRGVRGDSQRRG